MRTTWQGYDSYITNGRRIKCPMCGKYYYESDRGCNCTEDMSEEEIKKWEDDECPRAHGQRPCRGCPGKGDCPV